MTRGHQRLQGWFCGRVCIQHVFAALTFLVSASATADVVVDIRAASPLGADKERHEYVLRVSDCSDVTSMEVVAGATESFDTTDAQQVSSDDSPACEVRFHGDGLPALTPSATVTYSDGSTQHHSETFRSEDSRPTLGFGQAVIRSDESGQYLDVRVEAADDVDLRYVSFSLLGLRASDLRDAGGVVAEAATNAFAKTDGVRRVPPSKDGQTKFSLSVPVDAELSRGAIARDGLVLVEASAVDASGNQASLSRMSFTGGEVSEDVKDLKAAPERVVFTHLLESVSIVPEVQFEFRGWTPLPGLGTGVTYTSSDPDVVSVTRSGVVYPLEETNGEPVTVTVSYPGLDDVIIPVEVDPSKELVGLRARGVGAGEQFVIERLNQYQPLPEVVGVFDDGTQAGLASNLNLRYELPAEAEGVLDLAPGRGLRANAIVPSAEPLPLTIRLQEHPGISANVPVVAEDAPPEVSFDPPDQTVAGGSFKVVAEASDDVDVASVRIEMNGALAGQRQQPPYKVSVAVPEESAGSVLTFRAIVTDSQGQKTISPERDVRVVAEQTASFPTLTLEEPRSGQRLVEGGSVNYQLAVPLSGSTRSELDYVEFFQDGRQVAASHFPVMETRELEGAGGKKKEKKFELWRAEGVIGSISVDETSQSVQARAHIGDQSKSTEAVLVRVLGNQPPNVKLESPRQGETATAGTDLVVRATLTDEAPETGAALQLFVDGERAETVSFSEEDVDGADRNDFGATTVTHEFSIAIAEELQGQSLEIHLEGIDTHGEISKSQSVTIPVTGDQPPDVALARPQPGAHLVGGLSTELRAEATDDVEVSRVDFFVEDRLVGADESSPFSVSYEPPEISGEEQRLRLHAVAVDSAGQQRASAPVEVTLGADEQSPVVNVVSPPVAKTEGGESIAPVIENAEVVVKASGYDDVEVDRLELRGVARRDGEYHLTGNLNDRIAGEDFAPQQVPDAVNAFSALRLVSVPAFSGGAGVEYDRYPLEVEAWDAAGNSSTASVVVGVKPDEPPSVARITPDRGSYLPRGTVRLDIVGKDDSAVHELKSSFFLDGAQDPVLVRSKSADKGLTPGKTAQASVRVDLGELDLSNESHTLTVQVEAVDDHGQRSRGNDTVTLKIKPDNTAPTIGVSKPTQGSTLYRGDQVDVHWKAHDDSRIELVRFLRASKEIHRSTPDSAAADGAFTLNVPENGDELVLTVEVRDVFGNVRETDWRYALGEDRPPQITIRDPAQGSRLVEGEPFTMTVRAVDDRSVEKVEFFIESNGKRLFTETIDPGPEGIPADEYLSAHMRIPHRAENGALRIGALAVDSGGNQAEALLEVEILDDLEAPRIEVESPSEPLSVTAGDTVEVLGEANDNQYIDSIEAVLVGPNGGELSLEWAVLSRKDRVEERRVPNPDSFGDVIVGRRFYAEFEGRVVVPESALRWQGKDGVTLVVRVKDRGVNTTDGPAVPVTILGDEEAPTVTIDDLPEVIAENWPVTPTVTIRDNVSVADYKIYLADRPESVLAADQGVDESAITVQDVALGLDRFTPVPADGVPVTVVVEASDTQGNAVRETRVVRITPDTAPQLSLSDLDPESDPVKGAIAFHTLDIEDDLAAPDAPVRYMPVYTSLHGVGAGGARDPTGAFRSADADDGFMPVVSYAYPEADGRSATVRVAGTPYLEAMDGRLRVRPLPNMTEGSSAEIAVDPVAGGSVSYRVIRYVSGLCSSYQEAYELRGGEVPNVQSLFATERNDEHVAYVDIVPLVKAANGDSIDVFVNRLRIHASTLDAARGHAVKGRSQGIIRRDNLVMTALIDDAGLNDDGEAIVASRPVQRANTTAEGGPVEEGTSYAVPVPARPRIARMAVFAHGVDRYSDQRGPVALEPLVVYDLVADQQAPTLSVDQPPQGRTVVPTERLRIQAQTLDNSGGIKKLSLYRDRSDLVHEVPGQYLQENYELIFDVPAGSAGGNLDLLLVAEDHSGATAEKLVTLPVRADKPPQIQFDAFLSYKVNGAYQKVLTAPERLNLNEFWVRVGESFGVETTLRDDAGLKNYVIYRVKPGGERVEEYRKDWDNRCPAAPVAEDELRAQLLFERNQPTEYQLVVTDRGGNSRKRTFVVHPQTNMSPGVRITAPADGQQIAAGTFKIKVGVVATDDRELSDQNIEVYANGVKLSTVSERDIREDEAIGGRDVILQAFDALYDRIEADYGVAMADEYGRRDSPYAEEKAFVMGVPAGLIEFNEPVTLTAIVRDADNAVGRHEITFDGVADNINPEVAISEPGPGFGPPEASDFKLAFQAYDNVKVEQLELYTAYAVREAGGAYHKEDYGAALRTIGNVPAEDAEPVSTVNIDTPVYRQLLNVDRLAQIASRFESVPVGDETRFDLWVKVVVRDASGNERTREVAYRIHPDERPVIDVEAPNPGEKIVEGEQLSVNVKAFDDVGIEYVRLVAKRGANDSISFG
ncbi:Ig-like domain-containing protein [Arhodomonas sp. AD133]|uniref:Ig-like domain-containing protein n=1 Tax=Arhodomonas sp. AD133 TaxID=3415009 RepID=UPI003EBED29A